MVKELVKKKKKKWYSVLAPKLFNEALIGETFVEDTKLLIGRRLRANLFNLTGNMRHQSFNLRFEVTGIEDNTARTKVLGFEMSPASLKRIIRRNTNKLDESFVAETSDKMLVRIKPLLLTGYKTKGLILKTIRTELRKSLVNEAKKTTYENLIKDFVSHGLQRDMITKLRKIYPVKSLEIKRLELEKEMVGEEKKDEAEEVEEKVEKEGEERKEEEKKEKVGEEKGVEEKKGKIEEKKVGVKEKEEIKKEREQEVKEKIIKEEKEEIKEESKEQERAKRTSKSKTHKIKEKA